MSVSEPYEIISDGGLFCKCEHLADGRIRLIGKNTSITLDELQKKALNPVYAQKMRCKKGDRISSKRSCNGQMTQRYGRDTQTEAIPPECRITQDRP